MAAAESLTYRMDALAEALRAAGVDADRVASILGSAATATMNAVLLEAVVEQNLQGPAPVAPTELPLAPVEQPLRVAA
jgi:hypothetical protein